MHVADKHPQLGTTELFSRATRAVTFGAGRFEERLDALDVAPKGGAGRAAGADHWRVERHELFWSDYG